MSTKRIYVTSAHDHKQQKKNTCLHIRGQLSCISAHPKPTAQKGNEKSEKRIGAPPVTALAVQKAMNPFQANANVPVLMFCSVSPWGGISTWIRPSPLSRTWGRKSAVSTVGCIARCVVAGYRRRDSFLGKMTQKFAERVVGFRISAASFKRQLSEPILLQSSVSVSSGKGRRGFLAGSMFSTPAGNHQRFLKCLHRRL